MLHVAKKAIERTTVTPLTLLTVQEAAARLAISAQFLRLLITRDTMPCVRIGRRCLVRTSDVDAVIVRGGLNSHG
jgi:excisionase family DNA binding protein